MASASTEAPRQYSQPSRKGKKAWRKNVDITEIQSGLEGVREEIIKGGLLSEKPSSSLFTLDTTGSTEIKNTYNKKNKPLKSDEILARRSAVPAIDSHKRTLSRVTDGVIDPSNKRHKSSGVSTKKLSALKDFAYHGDSVHKDVVKTGDTAAYDPWAIQTPPETTWKEKYPFLDAPKQTVAPKTLRQPPISLTANGKPAPATRVPSAGISYNPEFEEWAQLLETEGQKELEAEKKRLQAAEEEKRKQEIIEAAQNEESPDADEGEESAWEGIESEYEDAAALEDEENFIPSKRPERKTPAQRNRALRRKEAERQAKHDAKLKKIIQQENQIRQISRELKMKDLARKQQLSTADVAHSSEDEEREKEEEGEGDERILRRDRFGKARIPSPNLELVLPDELQESLRLLKPEGNLLAERYRNMLVRGKMEIRKTVFQSKKVKREVTEKWSYKDFKLHP
ncbi:MAG: hypothetical protein M1834_005290 [Cirrosporium novae-zelandiae]|nr:MAG: hypothetical protein M1834_005290 [Cirrosporium novae-zelandiae]